MAETAAAIKSIPDLDISESVHEFAGQNGEYYARQFKRIQKSTKFCWSFNFGSMIFGPLWATARGLWGLFWVFSVLELVVVVMLGLGLWGDLGSDKFQRADKLQASYERMLERVENAKIKGDDEGVESFQARADKLLTARNKAIAEGEVIKAGALQLAIFGFIGLLLVKLFEGLIANHSYEAQYSRWRTERSISSGFNWTTGGFGLLILGFIFPITLLGYTSADAPEFIRTFPIDDSYYKAIAQWIDYWFDLASKNFAFFFQGISRGVGMLLNGLETVFVATPWPVTMTIIVVFAYRSAGFRVALFTAVALAYIAILGFWEKSMSTVALLGTASLLCVVVGIPFGVWFARSERAYAMARPVLDLMQTMPAFVYLIPIIAFFGTGKPPGVLASMIFGLPPIIRLTTLGLRLVPRDVVEAARAFGASKRQILLDVELPLAVPSIMAGVNQTILMCLSLVVIAALIDAKGLGYEVLVALQYAAKGSGILAGIAILFCAIVIDRIVQGKFNIRQSN